MTSLLEMFPDPQVLLALAPEDLAEAVLPLAASLRQNDMVLLGMLSAQAQEGPGGGRGYPSSQPQLQQIQLALAEAWAWLQGNGLLIPDPGINGANGWMRLSRRAERILAEGSFKAYARTVAVPKSLLHTSIADEVWPDLVRGDLETAVFKAFRAVEISVREAGMFSDADIGVPLMRKAFDKGNGPLTDLTQPEGERDSLAHLFSGAIGSYKNPHSHRTVTIKETTEALEMVILASHLLRIVDSRRRA